MWMRAPYYVAIQYSFTYFITIIKGINYRTLSMNRMRNKILLFLLW